MSFLDDYGTSEPKKVAGSDKPSNNFLNALTHADNRNARTENDAVTLKSSTDPIVDFFALGGACATVALKTLSTSD